MRTASLTAFALILAGCASSHHHGSYAVVAPPSEAQAMAADSLVELAKLYPPAISRLSIGEAGSDGGYGQALTDGLRKRGYAVVESSRKGKADLSAVPLRYVVDEPMPGLYRVMLRVGDQSLSRGYQIGDNGITPSAGWALNLAGASPELVERATRPDLSPGAEQGVAENDAMRAGLVPVDDTTRAIAVRAPDHVIVPVRTIGRRASAAAAPAGWRVQFASFRTEHTARTYWRLLVHKKPALAALKPRFPRSARGAVFVQAGPYRTVAFARRVCGGLSANACIVVKV